MAGDIGGMLRRLSSRPLIDPPEPDDEDEPVRSLGTAMGENCAIGYLTHFLSGAQRKRSRCVLERCATKVDLAALLVSKRKRGSEAIEAVKRNASECNSKWFPYYGL